MGWHIVSETLSELPRRDGRGARRDPLLRIGGYKWSVRRPDEDPKFSGHADTSAGRSLRRTRRGRRSEGGEGGMSDQTNRLSEAELARLEELLKFYDARTNDEHCCFCGDTTT